MKSNNEIHRDERTEAVEKSSYYWGYRFMAFALLFDVIYRSYKRSEAPFDLLGIVILSGLVSFLYQAKYQVLNRAWVKNAILTAIIAAVVGGIIAAVR